jgi:hypothetical protein
MRGYLKAFAYGLYHCEARIGVCAVVGLNAVVGLPFEKEK